MARPTKLTAETSKAITDALEFGATYRDAAEAAGVWYTTFLAWMKKGEEQNTGAYHEFHDQVRQAEASARLKFTAVIATSAKEGDWRAALEFLKRRDPENWREISGVEMTGKDGGAIETKNIITIIHDDSKDDPATG